MPVEHEIKHVLRDPDGLRDILLADHPCLVIDQIYLNPQVRYRRTKWLHEDGFAYEFTFKQSIGGRLLEQPCMASAEDFALARQAAVSSLCKVRFRHDVSPGVHWDIDFLLDAPVTEGGKVYFSLAEIEFPEGGSYGIPGFLAPFVDLVVPHEDSALFTNARLTDRDYARTVTQRYRDGWRG